MLQEKLLAKYLSKHPEDAAEVMAIKGQLTAASQNPSPLQTGHLTGSALLFDPNSQRVLLTHHKKLNRWLQFGGHVETHDHDIGATALRECKEESGIDSVIFADENIFHVAVHYIPETNGPHAEPAHYHYDICFLCATTDKTVFQASDESNSLRWFTLSEILSECKADSTLYMMAKKLQVFYYDHTPCMAE